jgi:hypothetical protein
MRRNGRGSTRRRLVGLCSCAILLLAIWLGTQASLAAGTRVSWVGPALIGLQGTFAFTPTAAPYTVSDPGPTCAYRLNQGEDVGTIKTIAPAGGWSLNPTDTDSRGYPSIVTTLLWASSSDAGKLDRAQISSQLTLTTPAGDSVVLNLLSPGLWPQDACRGVSDFEGSPIGSARPVYWWLSSANGGAIFGAGCGFERRTYRDGVVSSAPNGPPGVTGTQVTETFVVTDTPAKQVGLTALRCAAGRVVAPVPPKRCVVPNVHNLTLVVARRRIADRNCAVGVITRIYSRSLQKGRVVGQSPAAGANRPRNARVDLRISIGRSG